MVIKSFTADSVAAALKEVRTELGGEAVILKTRQHIGRGGSSRIEVTACLDNPTVAQASIALSDNKPHDRSGETVPPVSRIAYGIHGDHGTHTVENSMIPHDLAEIDRKLDLLLGMSNLTRTEVGHHSEQIQNLYLAMKEADVHEGFIETLIGRVLESCCDSDQFATAIKEEFCNNLSSMVSQQLEFKAGDRLLFVGPAGSGKTSVMGKLAASLVVRGREKVKLLSLDSSKVGALDEIHSYAELLGTAVTNPDQLDHGHEDKDRAIILIDSPALSPDVKKIQALKTQIEQLNPDYCFITLSCLTRTADMVMFAQMARPLSPTHLMMTMLDLTDRWGGIVAACQATGLKLALVTDSPSGVGTVQPPDPLLMARKILGTEVIGE